MHQVTRWSICHARHLGIGISLSLSLSSTLSHCQVSAHRRQVCGSRSSASPAASHSNQPAYKDITLPHSRCQIVEPARQSMLLASSDCVTHFVLSVSTNLVFPVSCSSLLLCPFPCLQYHSHGFRSVPSASDHRLAPRPPVPLPGPRSSAPSSWITSRLPLPGFLPPALTPIHSS